MPFALVGCFALITPRLTLLAIWFLGGGYLQRAYDGLLWPILGCLFMPLTTLAYAFGHNTLGLQGDLSPVAWILVGVAGAMDLGLAGRARKG